MNYLEDIYRLKFIKRYSNIPRMTEESVAEHGFFVAAIVIELAERYSFDLGTALLIAVSHDMTEIELNDCPHVIKKKYPLIAAAYEESEKEVAAQLPKLAALGARLFDEKEPTREALICHLADVIQCKQYATVELKLGNEGYMREVYNNSVLRIEQLELELINYEK